MVGKEEQAGAGRAAPSEETATVQLAAALVGGSGS